MSDEFKAGMTAGILMSIVFYSLLIILFAKTSISEDVVNENIHNENCEKVVKKREKYKRLKIM